MKSAYRLLGPALAVLFVMSCSGSKSKSGGGGGGAKVDVYLPPEQLGLTEIKADDASRSSFDFAKPSESMWTSSSELLLAHADGKNIAYDFKRGAWSSPRTEPSATDFSNLYHFRDAGFMGLLTDSFTLHRTPDPIVRLNHPKGFKDAPVIGVNPGFVAYTVNNSINVVYARKASTELFTLTTAPEAFKLVYPCNRHCVFWGWSGGDVYLFNEGTGWTKLAQKLQFPAGENIARMALFFRENSNPVAIESVFAQTDSGKLYAQVATSVTNSDVVWKDIKAISDRFCVACHIDDGFEKEQTWKTLKSVIVTRLQAAPGTKGAMPPTETNIGKEMSQGERNIILAWIEKQEQLERGTIGGADGPPVDNSDITGTLKKLADANCISCHPDARKNSYWSNKKAQAITRIESKDMPREATMSAADIKLFVDTLKAIK